MPATDYAPGDNDFGPPKRSGPPGPAHDDAPEDPAAQALAQLLAGSGDWVDKLRERGHTFAHLSKQAVDLAEGLGSDPDAAPTATVLLSLASTFDSLAGAFGTAHAFGTAVRGQP